MKLEEYFSCFYAGTKNPSLEVMHYFMEELGHPEKDLKVIHIAGTNGKGSITEMMSNILTQSGYRTGKFMSPHLICYNERIAINNQNITDEEFENLIIELNPKVETYNRTHDSKVTLFELQTTMAILYFARKQCDFVVMETGLGGLFDCTNIVNGMISIIASIGYDHMNLLGNTLEEIAMQKAGIIKEKGDTIFVKQEEFINKIIEKTCKEKKNQLHCVDLKKVEEISIQENVTKFSYGKNRNVEINLKGEKQIQNAVICLECVAILKSQNIVIADDIMRKALKTVIHKGRFETICENPKIIFDGAHNEPAISHLKDTIQLYHKNAKKVLILSIFDTKDYHKILAQLLEEDAIFIFTDGNEEGRFVPKETLYDVAKKIANQKTLKKLSMKEALQVVKEKYNDYVTFVVGSFYVYEMVKKELEGKNDTN